MTDKMTNRLLLFNHEICVFTRRVVYPLHAAGLFLATLIQFWPVMAANSSCHRAFGLPVGLFALHGRHWRTVLVHRSSSVQAIFLAHLHFRWMQRSRMSGSFVVFSNHSLVLWSKSDVPSIFLIIRLCATASLERSC